MSYASQDAEVVKRLATALREAGVEVWFDQNELVGGDAWDAKIRRQIGECALFVPVISAATQARLEGYFRVEWKLAAQRTHAMAEEKAFLLPVVIDATRDAEAKVPGEFRAVQWTRLPEGDANEAFCARVKNLLAGGISAVAGVADPGPASARAATPARASARPWLVPAALGAAALVALAIWQPWRTKETAAPASPPLVSTPTKPLTEAQQLVAKARKILDEGDEVNRETYVLSEELLRKAEGLDLTDASAWSLHTELSSRMVAYRLDYSPARQEALQSQAARAAKLAPGTVEAEIALAYAQIRTKADISALQERLTKLTEKFPDDSHLNRVLSFAGLANPDAEVAIAATQRALKRAPDDPNLKADLVWHLIRHSRFAEAEQAMRGALTGRQSARLWHADWQVKMIWRAEVDEAVTAVEQMPAWFLAEDRGCSMAALTYLWARKPARMQAVLGKYQRDYLRSTVFYGPRAVLTAWAHEAAGENEAALDDWRIVVQLADRELATTPDDTWAMHWKAWALAQLGDRDAARKYLRILEERNADISIVIAQMTGNFAGLALLADSKDAAIARLTRYLALGETNYLGTMRPVTRAMLRVNPLLKSLQGDPRFEALVAKAPGPEEKSSSAPSVSLDEKAVAVLPFANLSGDKEQEYFSDGLTEEILNALARERDLRVPGRTSSFSFKGKNASAAEIATALNVSRLVEGSVQRSGTKVRIRVSLTRVADNASEELGTFTEELSDIFALQDKVARAVVEKLTRRQLTSSVEMLTKNSEAYNFYLRGRALQTRSAEYADDASRQYEQAVASDPKFALAWVRLAETRFRNYSGLTDRSPDVVNGAREAIDRALSLQPNLTEALIMRANWVRNVERDLAAARRDLTRAEGLQAATADLRKAQAYLEEETGNWPEASRFYREALSLDPQNGDSINAIAIEYLVRGDFAEADRLLARAMAIQGPGFVFPFSNRIFLRSRWRGPEAALSFIQRAPAGQVGIAPWRAMKLAELGRLREARAEIEAVAALPKDLSSYDVIFLAEAVGLNDLARRWAEKFRADAEKEFVRGNRAPFVRLGAVNAEIILGHREKALALLDEWKREEQHGLSVSRRMFLFSFWAAPAYGRLGRADDAIAILREMETEGFNFNGYDLRYNLAYAPIRNDPRFQELMKQQEAWAKAQPDPVDP